MSNTFMRGLQSASNYAYTENGAITHKTTGSDLLDMFAQGAAYRKRSDEDCILLFKNAYTENPVYALKCLFYLRDVRGGQGERRFFRTCYRWLIANDEQAAYRNLRYISEYGRWDDLLYITYNTSLWEDAMVIVKSQLDLDVKSYVTGAHTAVSLLAKWLPSENTSSKATKELGIAVRKNINMTSRQYRKTLSALRERIKVLERLMSANRWDEIEFDKIPSKAGLKYRNAFARRDMIAAKYESFAKNKDTKVNAGVLYPADVAHQCFQYGYYRKPSSTDRAMLDKYWTNLPDYYHGREERGIAVVDVSGSMNGEPMEAAVSLGAYVAERGKGPFQNHFITFSGSPELVKFEGVDIYDKFVRAASADWGMNTNIEAVLDLLLHTAIKNKCSNDDIPTRLYIFSDMEFDACVSTNRTHNDYWNRREDIRGAIDTLFENEKKRWAQYGYTFPSVVFWNLRSAQKNIPAIGEGFSYVSGYSPVIMENILSGKDGVALMMDKLNSERYAPIK